MASRFATVSADDILTTNTAGVPTITVILLHYNFFSRSQPKHSSKTRTTNVCNASCEEAKI